MKIHEADINFDRLYRLAHSRSHIKDNARDIVHSAWIKLATSNKEYNNSTHVQNTLALNVVSLCIDSVNKFNTINKKNLDVDNFFYNRTCPIKNWEINYDANKIANKIKSPVQSKVFIKALDLDVGYGRMKELSDELNMTLNAFKVNLNSVRKVIKGSI